MYMVAIPIFFFSVIAALYMIIRITLSIRAERKKNVEAQSAKNDKKTVEDTK